MNTAGRTRPRFTPAQKTELLYRLRLTPQQVDQLGRHLPEIADWLHPQPRGQDVRDQLDEMARHLEKAEALRRRWHDAASRASGQPSAMAEALGHFKLAAGPLVRGDGSGLDLHDDLDPTAIITIMAYIARQAVGMSPGRTTHRTQRRASPEAIGVIWDALRTPGDEYSAKRARDLTPKRGGDFAKLAAIVWEAIYAGTATVKASPARSIQAFDERRHSRRTRTFDALATAKRGQKTTSSVDGLDQTDLRFGAALAVLREEQMVVDITTPRAKPPG